MSDFIACVDTCQPKLACLCSVLADGRFTSNIKPYSGLKNKSYMKTCRLLQSRLTLTGLITYIHKSSSCFNDHKNDETCYILTDFKNATLG